MLEPLTKSQQQLRGHKISELSVDQLKDWIATGGRAAITMYNEARDQAAATGANFTAEKPRYAIKCDAKTKYIYVKDVIKTFTDLKIYQFNLITSLEGGETVINPSKK